MARYRQWSTDDTRNALNWISGKMLGGAIWRDAEASDEDRLETLKDLIDQPELFAAKMKSWLKADAWKKLQGTLRQREHAAKKAQSGDESATAASDDPVGDTIAKFGYAMVQLEDALQKMVRCGSVLKLREDALQHARRYSEQYPQSERSRALYGEQQLSLAGRSSFKVDASGHALTIIADTTLATIKAASDDGETLTRDGAILMRVSLEPVKDQRHWIAPETGLGASHPQPDTWQHCGAAMLDAAEETAHETAAADHDVGGEAREADTSHIDELREIVNQWNEAKASKERSADRDQRILDLYRQGMKQVQIEKETGISRRTIGRVLSKSVTDHTKEPHRTA